MATYPSVAEIERISKITDDVARNRLITTGYSQLSRAFHDVVPGGANWSTFAAWASRQAGETIRHEDLTRVLCDRLKGHRPLARLLERVKLVTGIEVSEILRWIESILGEIKPFQRTSVLVARGNRKVFEEIAPVFSRYVDLFAGAKMPDEAALRRLTGGLRPGPPPEGQELLAGAFRSYHTAQFATGNLRSEMLLLGAVQIGFHEQTRLQPEIQGALEAAAQDPAQLGARLVERVAARAFVLPNFAVVAMGRLLAEAVMAVARAVVTEKMMVLELPGEVLRLARDLRNVFPVDLDTIETPELRQILAMVDPALDSTQGSGATDWANFSERMNFIAEFFRTRQGTEALFSDPLAL